MKKFWKKTEGFTLVELIVVIAILGILAGVGTVGYSGYVKKANMAADQQLVRDIETALELAGYAGIFGNGQGGYVLLSTDVPYTSASTDGNTQLDQALKNTFGENYSLQLKYNEWGGNSASLYNNLTPESAIAVKESSFLSGSRSNKLLSDVEIMTNMANHLVDVFNGTTGEGEKTLSEVFTLTNGDGSTTCVLDETAKKYGITKAESETWEEWAKKDGGTNKEAYSNLLVMAAAEESEKYMSTLGTENEYQMTSASSTILQFSSYYAFAAQNPQFSPVLDKYLEHLSGNYIEGLAPVDNSLTGATWFAKLQEEANSMGYTTDYLSKNNDMLGTSQAEVDLIGFLSIMAGLGNPSDTQAKQIGSDLNNNKLFTEGTVNGMYNDYLNGVDAISGLYDPNEDYSEWTMGLDNGNVAVVFLYRAGKIDVNSSIDIQ